MNKMEKDGFYMVWLEDHPSPTYKHVDFKAAENEARRLALKEDCKAYVLQAVTAYFTPPKVHKIDMEYNNLPF